MLGWCHTRGYDVIRNAGFEPLYENQVWYLDDPRQNLWSGGSDPAEHLEPPGGELSKGDKTKIEAPFGTSDGKDIEISGKSEFEAGQFTGKDKAYDVPIPDTANQSDMSRSDTYGAGFSPMGDTTTAETGFFSVRCAMHSRIASARRVCVGLGSGMGKVAFLDGILGMSVVSRDESTLSRQAKNDIWQIQASADGAQVVRLSNDEVSA